VFNVPPEKDKQSAWANVLSPPKMDGIDQAAKIRQNFLVFGGCALPGL
jgi:hypothetical protein